MPYKPLSDAQIRACKTPFDKARLHLKQSKAWQEVISEVRRLQVSCANPFGVHDGNRQITELHLKADLTNGITHLTQSAFVGLCSDCYRAVRFCKRNKINIPLENFFPC